MEFKGRYAISAPPQTVWAALQNPELLKQSIPGCESLEKLSDGAFKAKVVLSIGPVKARFEGKVQLAPQPPEAGYSHAMTLKGEGQGGPAGFAKGESQVRLAPSEGGTLLTYDAKAVVGGRLAQLGQRLIDGAAKSIADEFFAKFASLVTPAQIADETAPRSQPSPISEIENRPRGLPPLIWVPGLIALVLILLVIFLRVL